MIHILQIIFQLPAAARMAQAAQGAAFDLADALAGQAELLADLFQRVALAVYQAEAQAQDALLTRGQRAQHLLRSCRAATRRRRSAIGDGVISSSMNEPNSLSSSSPTGCSSDSGRHDTFSIHSTLFAVDAQLGWPVPRSAWACGPAPAPARGWPCTAGGCGRSCAPARGWCGPGRRSRG